MNIKKRMQPMPIFLLAVLLLTGCNGVSVGPTATPTPIPPTSTGGGDLAGLTDTITPTSADTVTPIVWRNIGPGDGKVYTLAIDPLTPTTLYAGTNYSVFKSTNNGKDWNALNGPDWVNINAYISFLAIDPLTPTILYGVGDRGAYAPAKVFKSIDGGKSWNIAGSIDAFVVKLVIDPVTPTTLYAISGEDVFYRSTDGGENWDMFTQLDTRFVYALAIDPLAPTTLYAGADNGGVFKSTDGGVNWSRVGTGLTTSINNVLAIDPLSPTTLYAGNKDGVFKSTNGGDSWNTVNTGLPRIWITTALIIDPRTPTTLYAGTWDSGVFRSTDGGGHWEAVNTGLTNLHVNVLAIDPLTPARLYAGTEMGIFATQLEPPDSNRQEVDVDSTVSPSGSQSVQIYLIAVEERGVSGPLVGCGDSVVPVQVEIPHTQGVLRAALESLLSIKTQYYGESGLYNALYQSDLQVDDIKIEAGKASVYLTGTMMLGGECDNPRVQAQLEQTVLQFSTITDMEIFVNGQPLADLLSLAR